ncbi:MAG: saccharopine dehydrogenase NADP-binding domain-containing protein [Thermoplasmata archaeon]|nr:saccharopine dehydrogenase NADP-binding domain-containing protein [Thermoplasmata archaeon]
MENVLVLGAGMVSKPLVRYLLEKAGFSVTVASRTLSKAERLINGHPNGEAHTLDVHDDSSLEDFVKKSDLVVSLLPYVYHVKVAELCIKHGKHLVTTSYVSRNMRELDKKAKDANVLLLNECGLDPGIDHMSAMRVIHDVESKGGKIVSFRSTTGALPAHDSNNNPFGYKFSWSPRGVLLASRNAAKWLENGETVSIPGEKLFEHYTIQDVPGVGSFENYPNRDSLPYKEVYGLKDAKTVYRGTFRMIGWCETMRSIAVLGWLNDKPLNGFSGKTYGEITKHLIKTKGDIIEETAKFLDLKTYSAVIKRLEWLGLFSNEPLPKNADNPLDYLTLLMLKKMSLGKNDRDMIIMHHEFIAEYSNKKEYITSTLLDYGIPNGDTAVARTVALPAAIAVKMILKGNIKLTGVHIPVVPEIYNPILNELEKLSIRFNEKTSSL